MLQRNKSISAWQSGMLLFVMAFGNKVLFFPSLIAKRSRLEAIITLFCLFLFDVGMLVLFYFAKKKFEDKNYFEVLRNNYGNMISIIFSILCCIFFFAKAVLLFSFFQNFMRSVMYKNAETILFLVCILPVAGFLALSGIRTLGRTVQLVFPLLAIVSVFCVIVGVFQLQSQSVLSTFSFSDLTMNIFRHIGSFGDGLFLFVFMDKISIKKGQWKIVFTLSSLGEILVLSVCIIYLFSYPYTTFLHPFAIFDLLSFVKEYNGLGRIDIIVVILLMFFFYFQFSIYMLSFVNVFQKNCTIFKDNMLVLIFDVLFVVCVYFFLTNVQSVLFFGENVMQFLTVIPIILLPILIFCAKKGG